MDMCPLKRDRHRLRESAGFTLLEVMVAVSILAVALVAILSFQGRTVFMADRSRFDAVAPFLAEEKMSELLSAEKDVLFSEEGDFGEEYPNFTWKTEVSEVISEVLEQADANLRKIHLNVSYNNGEHVYELDTLRMIMPSLKES